MEDLYLRTSVFFVCLLFGRRKKAENTDEMLTGEKAITANHNRLDSFPFYVDYLIPLSNNVAWPY